MITTVFSRVDVKALAEVLGAVLVVVYTVAVTVFVVRHRGRVPDPALQMSAARRRDWRMPQLSLLERPKWSRGRLIGMYSLRVYLVAAVLLLFVKAIQLGLHH